MLMPVSHYGLGGRALTAALQMKQHSQIIKHDEEQKWRVTEHTAATAATTAAAQQLPLPFFSPGASSTRQRSGAGSSGTGSTGGADSADSDSGSLSAIGSSSSSSSSSSTTTPSTTSSSVMDLHHPIGFRGFSAKVALVRDFVRSHHVPAYFSALTIAVKLAKDEDADKHARVVRVLLSFAADPLLLDGSGRSPYTRYALLRSLPSFVRSFLRSFLPSFVPSFLPSFLRSFVPSLARSFVHASVSFLFLFHLPLCLELMNETQGSEASQESTGQRDQARAGDLHRRAGASPRRPGGYRQHGGLAAAKGRDRPRGVLGLGVQGRGRASQAMVEVHAVLPTTQGASGNQPAFTPAPSGIRTTVSEAGGAWTTHYQSERR
jgi:hypothetical protein